MCFRKVTIFLFCFSLISSSCSFVIPTVKIHEQAIRVQIADDQVERTIGLMESEKLDQDEGMLFVFEKPDFKSFWMKNMKMSIDIIFIDENKKIIDIFEKVPPCTTDTCQNYRSSFPALYVLELKSGESERRELTIGDVIEVNF